MHQNRTIKFRIWNNKSKSWIHGPHERSSLDGVNLFGETILLGGFMDGISLDNLNDCVALQFTGVEDENGKEIFEGDIIKICIDDSPENPEWDLVEVKYFDSAFWAGNPDSPLYEEADWCEVIGNIFDNPELINEKTL